MNDYIFWKGLVLKDYKKIIADYLQKLGDIEIAIPDYQELYDTIEVPTDRANGDYAFPCFKLAKAFRKAPPMIAQDVAERVLALIVGKKKDEDENPIRELSYADSKDWGQKPVESVVANGGYVNFYINRADMAREVVDEVRTLDGGYGRSAVGGGRTVIVEYSSPNIAKPFHIGHIRSTVIGSAINNIYDFLGYKTVRINHLGDYGTQFGKMIVAYRKWGSREEVIEAPIQTLLKLYTKFHVEVENDPSLDDEARETFARLEQGGTEEIELWRWFREESLKEFGRVYKMLGIEFDSYDGESFYSDKMDDVLHQLEAKQLLKKDDGAQIVDLSEYDMPPALITKRDGSTLYITRDIAAAIYRKNHYDFYKNIYVVANQQDLHFKQWIQVLDLMGYDWARDCIHVPFGLVHLEDGVMSTRQGKVVFLEDVLNAAVEKTRQIVEEKGVSTDILDDVAKSVGIGAVIFNELAHSKIKDYTFSFDKVLNFEGETGPYVQYSHARAASILRKAEDVAVRVSNPTYGIDASKLTSPAAFELIGHLYEFPSVVIEAGERLEPSIITRHIVDIAQAFNKFYHDEHILVEDEVEKEAKLALVAATKITLKNGLTLLGIDAPERM